MTKWARSPSFQPILDQVREESSIAAGLYKPVFPQIKEKLLPGDAKDAVGAAAYRVLADQEEILENTLLFKIS